MKIFGLACFAAADGCLVLRSTLQLLRRLAVRPAWVTGGKPAPPAPARVVFLALEQEHVITQQDERIRAWTAAADVAMVVHIVGRDQRHHITSAQGSLVGKAHIGP